MAQLFAVHTRPGLNHTQAKPSSPVCSSSKPGQSEDEPHYAMLVLPSQVSRARGLLQGSLLS